MPLHVTLDDDLNSGCDTCGGGYDPRDQRGGEYRSSDNDGFGYGWRGSQRSRNNAESQAAPVNIFFNTGSYDGSARFELDLQRSNQQTPQVVMTPQGPVVVAPDVSPLGPGQPTQPRRVRAVESAREPIPEKPHKRFREWY